VNMADAGPVPLAEEPLLANAARMTAVVFGVVEATIVDLLLIARRTAMHWKRALDPLFIRATALWTAVFRNAVATRITDMAGLTVATFPSAFMLLAPVRVVGGRASSIAARRTAFQPTLVRGATMTTRFRMVVVVVVISALSIRQAENS